MSGVLPPELLGRLCRLVETLPQSVCGELAAALRETKSADDREAVANRFLSQLNPDNRGLLSEFADAWMSAATPGAEIAAGIEAAAFQERRLRAMSSVELVWTGPSTLSAGLRSTEQVILEMFRAARHSVYLVTFAAYKVGSLVAALREAIARGVRVSFVLEDKEESAGKVSVSALQALSGAGLGAVKTYLWPLERRQRNERGDHGSLHAKCVLVDGERLFVTSANMTEFALTLNIELGVLLTGGEAPRQAERKLTELIRTGVLCEAAR
jgi:phosphatidylserine/phosphatidylglycerophosphate/cardiolipin synthase-like enzyme